MSVLSKIIETLQSLRLEEDRPTAVLIIQNGDSEDTVNIHHVFGPGLLPGSAAHQLMAQTLDELAVRLGRIPPPREVPMPEGETSPLPAPNAPPYHEPPLIGSDSDGGESD